jgi:hypothetical protein
MHNQLSRDSVFGKFERRNYNDHVIHVKFKLTNKTIENERLAQIRPNY